MNVNVFQRPDIQTVEHLAGESSRSPIMFSVIIPVRNEERNIAKCLASLQRMPCGPEFFEVIVVDNGSTDRTREVASTFQKSLSLIILERPNVYISAVRNTGAAVAQGRYLAFLDSDCEVHPDWLGEASRAVVEGRTGVFGSFYLIPDGSSWVARHWYDERDKKAYGEISYLPSGNLFVSHELFRELGGFDESIQTNEDYEFCQRVRAAGFPITCIPALGVIHWGTPQSLAEFFRKNRWHGMHVFRVYLRSFPAFSNARPVLFAMYTLLCLVGIVSGITRLAMSKPPTVLWVSLTALALPSLLLSFRLAIRHRKWSAVLPLTILYLTYGLARATCLLGVHGDVHTGVQDVKGDS